MVITPKYPPVSIAPSTFEIVFFVRRKINKRKLIIIRAGKSKESHCWEIVIGVSIASIPKVTSRVKMFEPNVSDTATSPIPRLAAWNAATIFGMDGPRAPRVRPISNSFIPIVCARKMSWLLKICVPTRSNINPTVKESQIDLQY